MTTTRDYNKVIEGLQISVPNHVLDPVVRSSSRTATGRLATNQSLSSLLVAAACVLFGTSGTAQALGPESASGFAVGTARIAAGGLLVSAFGTARYLFKKGWVLPRPDKSWCWVALGAVCILTLQVTFFTGTERNGVAIGTVAAMGSGPLFAGIFEWLVFKKRPTLRWIVATSLAVTGIVAVSGLLGGSVANVDPLGLVASSTCGAAFAGYTISARVLLQDGWDPIDSIAGMFTIGGLGGLLILTTTDTGWIAEPGGIAVVAWLAVVTVFCAYLLVVFGLRGLSAATATTISLAEPGTAALLGVLILGETFGGIQLAGMAAIVCGVVIVGAANSDSDALEPVSSA